MSLFEKPLVRLNPKLRFLEPTFSLGFFVRGEAAKGKTRAEPLAMIIAGRKFE